MGVVSYIYQHDSCPRQADNIKVFVLRADGKYFLTLIFFFNCTFLQLCAHCIPTFT